MEPLLPLWLHPPVACLLAMPSEALLHGVFVAYDVVLNGPDSFPLGRPLPMGARLVWSLRLTVFLSTLPPLITTRVTVILITVACGVNCGDRHDDYLVFFATGDP